MFLPKLVRNEPFIDHSKNLLKMLDDESHLPGPLPSHALCAKLSGRLIFMS